MKKEENKPVKKPLASRAKRFLGKLIFLGIVAGAGYYVYKNPKYIEDFKKHMMPAKVENTVQTQAASGKDIENLYHLAAVLQDNIAFLNNKIAEVKDMAVQEIDMQSINAAIMEANAANQRALDSKADASVIMGLMTRLDKAEDKLDKVVKISDKGALVLSAVMLVKERADRGDPFLFEADILEQLADGELKVQKDVKTIVAYADEGVSTNQHLVNEFEKAYKKTINVSEEEGLSWKDRIKSKFNESVKVKKLNAEESEYEKQQKALIVIRGYVYKTEYAMAIREMEAMDVKNRGVFGEWLEKASKKTEFDRAVSRISAYSLALMKINQIEGLKR